MTTTIGGGNDGAVARVWTHTTVVDHWPTISVASTRGHHSVNRSGSGLDNRGLTTGIRRYRVLLAVVEARLHRRRGLAVPIGRRHRLDGDTDGVHLLLRGGALDRLRREVTQLLLHYKEDGIEHQLLLPLLDFAEPQPHQDVVRFALLQDFKELQLPQ